MLVDEYSRMSPGVILLLCFCFMFCCSCFFALKQKYLVLPSVSGLCSLPLWPPKQFEEWVWYHGVNLKSYKFLCHYFPSISRSQDTIVDQRVCGWVGGCISLLTVSRTYSSIKDPGTYRQRCFEDIDLTSLCSQSCVGFASTMNPCCQFVESNLLSWQ